MDPRLEIRLENPTRKSDYSHASDSVMLVISLKNRPTTSVVTTRNRRQHRHRLYHIVEIPAPTSVTSIIKPSDILVFVSPV